MVLTTFIRIIVVKHLKGLNVDEFLLSIKLQNDKSVGPKIKINSYILIFFLFCIIYKFVQRNLWKPSILISLIFRNN